MNKSRRKELSKAIDLIERACEIIEAVRDEEQEALDNMPEGLQQSERGEIMEGYIGAMDDILDALDTSELQEIVEG